MKKKKTSSNKEQCCNPNSGCCTPSSDIPRRDFLRVAALGIAALAIPLSACEFISETKLGHLIPADKMLSAEWIKSLTERGIPETYSSLKDELKYIGMPVGGICSGQLYISGDGRLWLWDIFQSNYSREEPVNPNHPDQFKQWRLDQFSMGGLYSKPRISSEENNIHQVKNGFSIQYKQEGTSQILNLNSEGFNDITFRGEYPIAKVSYKKDEVPFSVALKAHSPFIPLNVKDSSIPTTILSYKVTNNSTTVLKLAIGGWLENKVSPEVNDINVKRKNTVISSREKTTVFMTATGNGLKARKGYGNMAISLLGDKDINAGANSGETTVFNKSNDTIAESVNNESLIGSLSTTFELQPNESKTITFLVSWYFPYYTIDASGSGEMGKIKDFETLKRHYAANYSDANDVATYVANHFKRLSSTSLNWNKTWYDSTLPHWFLDRSFISLDCLASQTSHLFDNGRFWGWEGVNCCEGTCTHVWQYAQGMARIFPTIERDLRESVDYGISYKEGSIAYRGENSSNFAIDGQLGTIIRVYREHKMAKDTSFLSRVWKKVKASMQFIIDQDKDTDGLLEGQQPHTLDAAWFGPMGWISGLYIAALSACEQMALEVGDNHFATQCKTIISNGQKNIVDKLFNGEYFIHLPPDYNTINTNDGCHIDQVLGQSFAHQVNLPNVLPKKETRSALKALWKYNFAPDAGQYAIDHKEIKGDRLYVMPGEAALLMTTWPFGGSDKAVPGMADRPDNSEFWIGPGGYFDECMNGFEYQVSSHMVWEGMLTEGLSIMKAVHERYNGAKRNPYDEVECSSHYARSMASYGVYLAACGFSYHGPKGELGFAPKINPEQFKCAFTTAEGWGSFTQEYKNNSLRNSIELQYGQLELNQFNIELPNNFSVNNIQVSLAGIKISLDFKLKNNQLSLNFERLLLIKENEVLIINVS